MRSMIGSLLSFVCVCVVCVCVRVFCVCVRVVDIHLIEAFLSHRSLQISLRFDIGVGHAEAAIRTCDILGRSGGSNW